MKVKTEIINISNGYETLVDVLYLNVLLNGEVSNLETKQEWINDFNIYPGQIMPTYQESIATHIKKIMNHKGGYEEMEEGLKFYYGYIGTFNWLPVNATNLLANKNSFNDEPLLRIMADTSSDYYMNMCITPFVQFELDLMKTILCGDLYEVKTEVLLSLKKIVKAIPESNVNELRRTLLSSYETFWRYGPNIVFI